MNKLEQKREELLMMLEQYCDHKGVTVEDFCNNIQKATKQEKQFLNNILLEIEKIDLQLTR